MKSPLTLIEEKKKKANESREYERKMDREAKRPRIIWDEDAREYKWWPKEPRKKKEPEPYFTNWFGGCAQCRE